MDECWPSPASTPDPNKEPMLQRLPDTQSASFNWLRWWLWLRFHNPFFWPRWDESNSIRPTPLPSGRRTLIAQLGRVIQKLPSSSWLDSASQAKGTLAAATQNTIRTRKKFFRQRWRDFLRRNRPISIDYSAPPRFRSKCHPIQIRNKHEQSTFQTKSISHFYLKKSGRNDDFSRSKFFVQSWWMINDVIGPSRPPEIFFSTPSHAVD